MTKVKMLKIKIKSLAEEARIIRTEERKSKGWIRNSLRLHRIEDVRREARHSLLAYAFLRGVPYHVVENYTETPIDWSKVQRMVSKFGVAWADQTYDEYASQKAEQDRKWSIWIKNAQQPRREAA